MPNFFEREWSDLGERVRRTANHFSEQSVDGAAKCDAETSEFLSQEAPKRYDELLDRHRKAAQLAISWREAAKKANDPG